MDDLTDDDLFLDAVDAIVIDALAIIGDDPRTRYAIFRRLLAVAQEVAAHPEEAILSAADRLEKRQQQGRMPSKRLTVSRTQCPS